MEISGLGPAREDGRVRVRSAVVVVADRATVPGMPVEQGERRGVVQKVPAPPVNVEQTCHGP